ncbi:RagB/SusD family nutrient uptake outer membrane protein [Bacteroides helcogenes]|uniref:Lipoprotein n=1 Tax=Bacteroides helcogenes (strain ATCC 35417 / DSM 20613 / JCM 6297 / CCUG 15421 / P 36-108) TaxID=693979 RepID=E6SVG4_BACT6|nr:RagB/SusD family nutrient uptake outer membrane protein [Bacteroides helcogenes]ADV42474.1 hypothetical protein Bache_0448 [Bacteroides helcogenes P 36-108]MDY5237766.1 RagB/SusD family nutrient uptake outer membrane protein [Bacteroides helcogenes]
MKNILKYTGAALAAVSLLTACTGAFEDMNTNPKGVTDDELKQDNNFVGMHFLPMMQSIYFNKGNGNWEYQLIQNLNADIFSGYMASGSNFAVSNNNMHYALNHGWNDYCWNYAYNEVMSQNLKAHNKCVADMDTYAHFDAINTIIRVLTMSRLCDQYGPIIYSAYGQSMTGGTYDSGQDAYKQFFTELAAADAALGEALKKSTASFANFDMAYGGDLAKWAKLANSLRLRLAIRIAKYDAAEAKKQAEAVVADANGLIKDNADNFTISSTTYKHPLYAMTNSYHDILLNANVSSILSGYKDARLEKMALPNEAGNLVGIRNGVDHLNDYTGQYKSLNIASMLNVGEYTPVMLFSAAETYFLLAEAALRGWNVGGTAENFYTKGVQTSFEQWGADMGSYLSSSNKPADFVDALVPEYNHAAVETATPNWSDAKTDEERLEKIIVQKWIAVFPEGMNAWAEYRRTGYPKQFPIMRNDSQGDQAIPTELGVRRLTYTESERDNNPTGYAGALQKLGGSDTGATRIFWDVDAPNL